MLRSGCSRLSTLKRLSFSSRATFFAVDGISWVSPSAPAQDSALGSSALSSRISAWSRSGSTPASAVCFSMSSRKALG